MNASRSTISLALLFAIACTWSLTRGADTASDAKVDTDVLVRQALDAELDGDLGKRTELLVSAQQEDQANPLVNWQLGNIQLKDGQWLSVSQLQQLNAIDERIIEYREFRDRLRGTAKMDWELAEWCTRNGMKDVADVHYRRVVGNPAYDANYQRKAMRRLDLQLYQGALLTEREIKEAKQAAREFKQACQRWVPRLKQWQETINADTNKSQQASDEFLAAEDPYLAGVTELFIPVSGDLFGEVLITKLSEMDSPAATAALVRFAVLSPLANVRDAAVDELRHRPLHDYVPMLLTGLASPIQTEWTIVEQADGSIAYEHLYYREGPEANYAFEADLVVRPTSPNAPRRNLGDRLGRDVDVRRTRRTAEAREQQAAEMNLVAALTNDRVYQVLEQTTRAQVPREPTDWWQWWQDYNETEIQKQTQYGYQYSEQRMTRVSPAAAQGGGSMAVECFVAGTPIWTETGLQRVEFIQIGDRVLSQDPETGELLFKPVMATTVRRPTPVVEMTFDSEKIIATLGHPMWVTGEGWRMAKFLLPGDQLRTVHGGTFVKDVERPEEPASAYNLIIADFHTYFVGEQGILVHDSMYRVPTRAVVPGLKLH